MSPPCWISIEISAVGLRTDGDSRCFTAHGSRGFVKVARPDRFLSFRLPYTDPVGSAHRQHERWTGQGTTVHRGSGSPRAKHKEMTRQRAPQEQDVRSVAPRFFSGVCCSFLSLSLSLQLLSLPGVVVPRLPPRGRSECLRMVVSPRDLSQPSCRFLASPSRTGKQSAQRGLASRQREKEATRTTAGRFLLDSCLLAR